MIKQATTQAEQAEQPLPFLLHYCKQQEQARAEQAEQQARAARAEQAFQNVEFAPPCK